MLFPLPQPQTAESLANRETRPFLLLASILLMFAALVLVADIPVFRFCSAGKLPGDLRRLLGWSELFAHGLGCAILALTIFVLDPSHRRHLARVITAAIGAGLLADLVKLTIARVRPNSFSGSGTWETFAGWLPTIWPVEGFSRFDHRLQSFPSAHVAVATGLAAALTALYPRGRYLFAFFAVLAAAQRIDSGAHYLSDTCAGAAVGCLVAAVVCGQGPVARAFDKFEHRGTKVSLVPSVPSV